MLLRCLFAAAGLLLVAAASSPHPDEENALAKASRGRYPQVIAHRGASGYIPEHSLQAYQTAMDLEADYVEPDLCLSKDGIFVALHDVLLDDTTDVATLPEFASRKTTRDVDGVETTGFFVNDFTWAELQTLTLRQRLPFRTPLYNGVFRIPSLQQIAKLVADDYNSTQQRLTGLYIEPKHPSYFASLGWDMDAMLLEQLVDNGYLVSGPEVPRDLKRVVPVVIQCFEADFLKRLRPQTNIPLVLLLNPPTPQQLADGSYWSQTFLADASAYADGLGPEKTLFATLPLEQARQAVAEAHAADLVLHPWTFRAEAQYIGKKFNSDFELENTYYLCCLGIDGLFSEFPDRSREVVDGLLKWFSTAESEGCPVDCQTVGLPVM